MKLTGTIRSAVAALALAALATTPLLAQGGRPHAMGPMGQGAGTGPGDGQGLRPMAPFGQCITVLDLSDTQKADLKAILEAEAPTLKSLHQQMRTDREALRTLLDAESPVACDIGTAMLKVDADRQAIKTEMDSLRLKLEAILTAEQKLKFEGCMEALKDRGHRP